jgi:predicted RNase H-like nuclease
MAIVGVDACKSGWIAIVDREGSISAEYLRHITDIETAVPDAKVIAIDIPIGLPLKGKRLADLEAQRILGKRASTLFVVPVRAVLDAVTHLEATKLSLELCGFGISRQSFALRSKILEVDEWLPSAPCPVFEVHPELSFAELCGGAVMPLSKKSWAGMITRREALMRVGFDLDHIAGEASKRASTDDMLDAAVSAWSARRILEGRARSIPATPDVDSRGQMVAIWT